ncbi:ComF family protein [Pseudomonas sp. nanlin1]|uniref:ComF family protein n=1 Tax=Pseudomonas sp. nanlin1 TaxID=3040605 RepID=UPI00388F244B
MRCQPSTLQRFYIWLKNNQTCLLCDEPADTAHPICSPCEGDLPWLQERCKVCALPLALDDMTCGQCLRRPPAFTQVEVPWHYAFPLDSLIGQFKHQGRWPLGRLLGDLLGQWLQHRYAEGLPRPQRLLPVPMAAKRLRQRGFNQAALLARWLASALGIPCDENLLRRPHHRQAQQALNAKARRHNLQGVFTLAAEDCVEGQHLAVVDDVLTTGATAHALAQLLRQAGAARVDIYCLARTPKPNHA